MGKKYKDKTEKSEISIKFLGNNSTEVTGSCILVKTKHKKILLECGMVQGSSNPLDDFKINAKPFPFKPKDIDYVFLNHAHIDHSGLLPKLLHNGFKGQIFTTEITAKLLSPMLKDSCKIIENDARILSKKRKKLVLSFYNEDDVADTLNCTYEYDFDKIYDIDENISFKFIHNSHIIGASQLELYIKNSMGVQKTILYTSDLGSLKVKNHYVDDTEKCTKASIIISESTYGARIKETAPNRDKDLEKLNVCIRETCLEKHGRILIPVFSLARSQEILTNLYEMYGHNSSFNIPIIVDSPLLLEINKVYREVLKDDNAKLFNDVCNWKNVKFVKNPETSLACIKDTNPKIVLSSSGFLLKGRSVQYLQEFISNPNDCVVSVGYSPSNSTFHKIKNGDEFVKIEKRNYKINCSCLVLNSFSSHIPRHELLLYLKSIYCDSVYLVHGEETGKLQLKEDLETEYSKLCRSTNVISTIKDCVARL